MARAQLRALACAGALSIGTSLVGGCWLSHERPPLSDPVDAFVAPIDAFTPDAFTPDAFRPDAFVPPVDAPPPDRWTPPLPARCVDAADQHIRPSSEGRWFERVTAIDLDGDGRSELVALGRSTGLPAIPSVHVLRHDGARFAEVWQTPPTEAYDYPYGSVGSDIDLDGDLDVLASLGGLRVLENRAGELVDRGVVSATLLDGRFEADDLDGDGDIDVLAGSAWADRPATHLLTQGEGGTFTESLVGGGLGTSAVRMLHRGDTVPQLLASAEIYSGVFRVFERAADTWNAIASGDNGTRLSGLAAADFDRDGLEDFVVMRFHGQGPWFYWHRPGGAFARTLEGNPAIGGAWANEVHDMEGDGDPDLVVGSFTSGTLWLYESTPGFEFIEHETRCSFSSDDGATGVYDLTIGDFDGDGLPDIAIATSVSIITFGDAYHRLFLL